MGKVSVGETLGPVFSPPPLPFPWCHLEAFRRPESLEAREESCSEERPWAQVSANVQLSNPRLLQGSPSFRFKSFLRTGTKWASHHWRHPKRTFFQLHGLKSIWKTRTTRTPGIKCRKVRVGFKLTKSRIPWYFNNWYFEVNKIWNVKPHERLKKAEIPPIKACQHYTDVCAVWCIRIMYCGGFRHQPNVRKQIIWTVWELHTNLSY